MWISAGTYKLIDKKFRKKSRLEVIRKKRQNIAKTTIIKRVIKITFIFYWISVI